VASLHAVLSTGVGRGWWASTAEAAVRLHAVVESYPPRVNAGSEVAAHTLFRYLTAQGWDVTVHETRAPSTYDLNGVHVQADASAPDADLVYTHLWEAYPRAVQASRDAGGCPLVYWIHANSPMPPRCDYYFANTQVLLETWQANSVLHPPVFGSDYRGAGWPDDGPHDRVTRIGLSEAKGGKVFYELARRMPAHKFLGVVGAWGRQVIEEPQPNTWIWGNTTDMRAVYANTRVLIIPSDGHETYARIAVEAIANGIPVIAHPWEGISEALGNAAIWADRHDLPCWEALLECLSNPREYTHHKRSSLSRYQYVQRRTEQELADAEAALRGLL
jgi:glycosyltransferase involved in cell wall biosynthesis